MATAHSADSTFVESGCVVFISDRVVNSFPRYKVVKLDEGMFIQWQQHVRLILCGYNLIDFLDGTFSPPVRFIQSTNGSLAPNSYVRANFYAIRLFSHFVVASHDKWLLTVFFHRC